MIAQHEVTGPSGPQCLLPKARPQGQFTPLGAARQGLAGLRPNETISPTWQTNVGVSSPPYRRHVLTTFHPNGPNTTDHPEVLLGERMLTVSEAALMLSAHPNSVRRWADMGLLPAYRFGQRGDRRFKLEDLSRFLESGKLG